mgnify:CR=1 FL=1
MFLNHSKAEIRKMKKSLKVRICGAILKKLPDKTVNRVTYEMEQLAKRNGIKSIFNKVKRKAKKVGRKVKRKAKKVKGKFKRARTARTRLDNGRYESAIPNKRIGRKYKKYTAKKRKGIHYTKTGQPYMILASGQARFVKRK